MDEKVQCKICGKVGLAKNIKALRKHLHFRHNLCNFQIDDWFIHADPEVPIDILSCTRKAFMKYKNSQWTDWQEKKEESPKYKKPLAKIIFTPMGNKR